MSEQTTASYDGDWRAQRLEDGRVVEFLDAQWAPEPTPGGAFGVEVTYALDGVVRTSRVLLTAEQILAAVGDDA